MANIFQEIEARKPNTNVFNLSNDHKLTLDMGLLVPVYLTDTVPGDHFSMRAEALLRFAPLIAPVMHSIDVYIHWFFVPNRIVWPSWEKFITNSAPSPSPPVNGGAHTPVRGSVSDYFGLPVGVPIPGGNINMLPYAAYNKIYNEYYRDQNLIAEVTNSLIDGNNSMSGFTTLRRRAWRHDYFTSALPWPQKGAEALVPMGQLSGFAPVITSLTGGGNTTFTSTPSGAFAQNKAVPNSANSKMWADLANADSTAQIGATSINDLRRALRLQEWLEKTARGGSRYIEHILSHFGVRSSDRRLDRPEFIGGSKNPVVISEVLQTSGTPDSVTEGTPQANMAGHGIAVDSGKTVSYYTEEHGWIMCIMSVMPRAAYQQGIHRMFTRKSPFDYYWPSFAHLGEQPVRKDEIYATNDANLNAQTFGYTPRYAEYKYKPSQVSGDFRSSLSFWHLGRIFQSAPALNQTFVECDPSKRIFAVTDPDQHSLYSHVFTHVRARRPMPVFGTPSL